MAEQEFDCCETLELEWAVAEIEDCSRICHEYCFKSCEKNQN